MRISFAGVLGDAAAMWRNERDVLLRLAGVFFLLPILALAMLATGLPIADQATPEEVRATIGEFYAANLIWLVLITLAFDLGGLAMLTLFLRPSATVGEILRASALRLLPFALLGFANGALFNLGFTLFVIPGIYIFGRTWMMGAAYAAAPERGLLSAIERGFKIGANNGWRIAIVGIGTAIIGASAAFAILIVVQILTVAAGGAQWLHAVLLVPVAGAGAATYVAFTLVRIAAYRRLDAANSGT